MSELNCYITTFNCGRAPIDIDYFAANLLNGLKTNLPPDLIVLSLQEIAPIAYSFLGLVTPYLAPLSAAVSLAALQKFGEEAGYERVVGRHVGLTGIMVFARQSLVGRVRNVETAGVGVGVWNMGNKGAVGARIVLETEDQDMVLTFVAAHLAPMEGACQRRNEDWKHICEGLVFEKDVTTKTIKSISGDVSEAEPLLSTTSNDGEHKGHSLFAPVSHVFFAGDLNYRTSDTPPQPGDEKEWPQPVESVSDVQHYSRMLQKDQLTRELRKNNTLHNLAESEITFPPTYKYSNAAQKAAIRDRAIKQAEDDPVYLWAIHRVPSWCDRILYLAAAPPRVNSYVALPVQPTSDHRPVALSLSIPLKPLGKAAGNVKPPFPVNKEWKQARAAARRYELVVGFAAYLALTWEGEALLAGSVIGIIGGYLVLRAMIGT